MKYSMKNISFLLGFILCLVMNSCSDDFLDKKPDDKMDEQQVFERYNKVDGLVTKVYDRAKAANRPLVFFNHFSTAPVTDECEGSTAEKSLTNVFNAGGWSSMGMPDRSSCGQYWWDLYDNIRKANVILEGVRKYNTPDNVLNPGELEKRIGEVYFFRAYFHYLLIRMYGEVPYIDHTIDPQGNMDFKKESYHAVVEKICADADSAYSRVPDRWLSTDFGRVEKGACLGLKAMVRWMAATPMWNGGTMPDDTRQFKAEYTYDKKRWEAAKAASKALLDFKVDGAARYTLYTGDADNETFKNDRGKDENGSKVYKRLWNMYYDMNSIMNEWVWFATRDKSEGWQGDCYPPTSQGSSRQMPVQEQVDEYEYIGPDGYGYPVYADRATTDGYDDGNPYASVKRDPRFHRDIMYHGAIFKNSTINTAEGNNRIGGSNATTTGYYLRKFFKEGWNRDQGFIINGPAIWRLPEFIYIYAEAVNETTGPNQEIYDLINQVRARSWMAPMPPSVLGSKELMNQYIQRERRVELFYENNRIWSSRLYLEPSSSTELAKETQWMAQGANYWPYPKCQRAIHGMRPVEDANGKIVINGKKYRMERYKIEDRVFVAPRHYLFPIMDDEIKRTPSLVQNPGW